MLLYDSRGRRTTRLPGGTRFRPSDFVTTPPKTPAAISDIDLGPRALVFVWLRDGREIGGIDNRQWELWLDSRASRRRIAIAAGQIGGDGYDVLTAPSAAGLGLQWVHAQSARPRSDPSAGPASVITSYDASTGAAAEAATSSFAVEASRDGAVTWWLRASGLGLRPAICRTHWRV